MIRTRFFAVTAALALSVGACAQLDKIGAGVVTADKLLSDKCGYLADVVRFAPLAIGIVPAAAGVAERAVNAAQAYCSGGRVSNISSALDLMERIIIASRPIATKVGQNR